MGYKKSSSQIHSLRTIFFIKLKRLFSTKTPYIAAISALMCVATASVHYSFSSAAPTCDRNANSSGTLATQFAAASSGETICLATGNYGTWTGGSKSVTITAADGATPTMALDFNNGDSSFVLDGLTITTGSIVNNVSNITIRNSTFTGILLFDNIYNSNILLENNTHNNIEFIDGNPAGRISFPYGDGSTHSGVTIQDSLFRGGSSDGIQTGVGVNIFNNEFDNIQENGHPTAHTDTIQLIGASGSVVRGNYVHDGATGIVAYDGVSNVLIEHNVVTTDLRPEGIELYTDTNSVVQHNTVIGSIYLDHKPADPAGTGTIIKDNIATSVLKVGGSSTAEQTNNLLSSGGEAGDITGTPVYIGGSHPTSYDGYKLASGSAGIAAASDGEDIGIVVADDPGPDTTAPEIELTNPTDGATVQSSVALAATAIDNIGIAGVTFKYGTTTIGSEDTSYPYSLNWNTTSVSNGVYTLTAIARDSSNNTTTSEIVTVTVDNNSESIARSLWSNSTIPATVDSGDTGSVELGLKFRSAVAGYIKGVRFYKATTNTGTHVGRLYTLNGTEVANVTFMNESASGWQEALFDTPYLISANTPYMITYHTSVGRYSVNSFFFSSSSFENYPLTAVQDNQIDGRNGMFRYGSGGIMPDSNFNAGNYWVDVVFEVPDTTPPSITIDSPVNNAYVRGTINIGANSSDNVGVVGVQFKRGCPSSCINIGSEDTTSPFTSSWDTTQVSDGDYAITGTSRDAAGNSTTATNITVHVDNTAPNTSITGHPVDPSSSANPSFTFAANETATFECSIDGGAFTICSSPRAYSNLGSGDHSFEVRATDQAGNIDATPALFEWEIDITAPSVSLTAPLAGEVSGNNVTLSATGSDNRELTGIQFKVDGTNIGSEDTTAPFAVQWDSTSFSNGIHTITAVARDSVGNTATSSSVQVTVNNATTTPVEEEDNPDTTSPNTSQPSPSSTSPSPTTEVSDSTPPTMRDIRVTNIGSNSATIIWTTSEAASSEITYYSTTNRKMTAINESFVDKHTSVLSDLEPGTIYSFVLKNTDESGNVTISEEFDFTTLRTEDLSTPSTEKPTSEDTDKPASKEETWIAPTLTVVSVAAGLSICVVAGRALIVRLKSGS